MEKVFNADCFLREYKFLLHFIEMKIRNHDQHVEVEFVKENQRGSSQQICPQRKALGQYRGWRIKEHSYILS